MRTLGLVGLSVLLILVLLYQSYFLTEGFGFGIPAASTDTSGGSIPGVLMECSTKTQETCTGPQCVWNKYHDNGKGICVNAGDKIDPNDRQGVTGGLLPSAAAVHDLNIMKQDLNKAMDSSYSPYRPSAADRKQQRAKLLRDIQKIVHNEILNERGTTGSRYPSNGSCGSSCDEDSCDNSPALQQGCEMEDSC
jgi:hypothetical protein